MQGGLYFWSYVYYLSKYYELLDTVVLILKVKRNHHHRSWAVSCPHVPPATELRRPTAPRPPFPPPTRCRITVVSFLCLAKAFSAIEPWDNRACRPTPCSAMMLFDVASEYVQSLTDIWHGDLGLSARCCAMFRKSS